jgi:hypothetical protein
MRETYKKIAVTLFLIVRERNLKYYLLRQIKRLSMLKQLKWTISLKNLANFVYRDLPLYDAVSYYADKR